MKFHLDSKKLKLKVNWKIARNESAYKENFFVTLHEDGEEFISEIAPNIRYGETRERVLKEFAELSKLAEVSKESVLAKPWAHSFKSAVLNTLLKRDAKVQGYGIEEYLGLGVKGPILTSFSIPIMDVSLVKDYLQQNVGFHCYKLKVSDSSSFNLLKEVSSLTNKPLRIDANEGFKSLEEYLDFEKKIESMNIEFIEQPFPASMIEEYKKLKPISKYEIIADESVEDDFDAKLFQELFHGVNVKQMKACGIERSKYLLEKAKRAGLKTMIGCMIESSLGIREAMSLSMLCDYVDLDGPLLLSNDPFSDLIQLKNGHLSLS